MEGILATDALHIWTYAFRSPGHWKDPKYKKIKKCQRKLCVQIVNAVMSAWEHQTPPKRKAVGAVTWEDQEKENKEVTNASNPPTDEQTEPASSELVK